MDDLIDRQAAIDAVNTALFPKINTAKDAEKALRGLPSAQPEIIRCKDCKYVGTDATCCLVCNRDGMGLRPFHVYHDDFCSYAEGRADEPDR